MEIVIGLVIGLLAGAVGGYFVRKSQAEKEVGSAEARAKTILESAGRDAEAAKREALIEAQAREEADRRARKIIAIAMQRVASELTTESTVTTVTLPNEDMKGRIIG